MTCKLAIMSLRMLERCLGKGMTMLGVCVSLSWEVTTRADNQPIYMGPCDCLMVAVIQIQMYVWHNFLNKGHTWDQLFYPGCFILEAPLYYFFFLPILLYWRFYCIYVSTAIVCVVDADVSIEGVWLDIASTIDLHKRLLALQVGLSPSSPPLHLSFIHPFFRWSIPYS